MWGKKEKRGRRKETENGPARERDAHARRGDTERFKMVGGGRGCQEWA